MNTIRARVAKELGFFEESRRGRRGRRSMRDRDDFPSECRELHDMGVFVETCVEGIDVDHHHLLERREGEDQSRETRSHMERNGTDRTPVTDKVILEHLREF